MKSAKLFLAKIVLAVMVAIVALGAVQPVKPAEALGVDWVNAAIQKIGHALQSVLQGVTGAATTTSAALDTTEAILEGLPAVYGPAREALEAPMLACENVTGGAFTDLVDGLAGSLVEAGDQTKSTSTIFVKRKLLVTSGILTCLTSLEIGYKTALTSGALTLTEVQRTAVADALQGLQLKVNKYSQQRTQLVAQEKATIQDLFRAIALGVALSINERYTARTVKDLVPKLAVADYLKTERALTYDVYASEYIETSYKNDKEKQLIMSSFLDAEVASRVEQKKQSYRNARALVTAKVEKRCPKKNEMANWGELKTLVSASDFISPECSIDRVYDDYFNEFQQIIQKSKDAAKTELTNGGGFMSTRTCEDVTNEENKKRELSQKTAEEWLAARYRVSLYESYLNQTTTASEQNPSKEESDNYKGYKEALENKKTLDSAMDRLPEETDGGIIPACSPINDPGGFVKTGLDNYVNQWLGQNSSIRSDNIPLYAKLAKTLTKKLFGSIFLGQKNNGKKQLRVLRDSGHNFSQAILTGSLSGQTGEKNPITGGIKINPIFLQNLQDGNQDDEELINDDEDEGIINDDEEDGNVEGESTATPAVSYFSPRGAY